MGMTERCWVTEGCGVQVAARLESEARAAHGKLVAAGDTLEALAHALETKEADALVQAAPPTGTAHPTISNTRS